MEGKRKAAEAYLANLAQLPPTCVRCLSPAEPIHIEFITLLFSSRSSARYLPGLVVIVFGLVKAPAW